MRMMLAVASAMGEADAHDAGCWGQDEWSC